MSQSPFHIVRTREQTPFEKYRRLNPDEAARLTQVIASLTGCQEPNAKFVLQEIINAIWRDATNKTRELGIV